MENKNAVAVKGVPCCMFIGLLILCGFCAMLWMITG
jgi:hypothetical protein